jgi:hypothetical protein
MDVEFNINCFLEVLEKDDVKVDAIKFQKMLLIFNSIDNGWSVKKRGASYVFTKPHENKKEVLENNYIMKFMKTNLDLNKIIS